MPRYYFHVHDGREIRDHEGVELPDLAQARAQALTASGEMLRDYGLEFWTGHHWQMYVEDESGKTVLRLNFSAETDEIVSCGEPIDAERFPFEKPVGAS
jgi:hypothetical protein